MSDRVLRSFLANLGEMLQPDYSVRRTQLISPPEWKKLGWRVGWILEERNTGIQFLLTKEEHWPVLSGSWGSNRRQKKQVFSGSYSKILNNLASKQGKPLSLKSSKWRKADLAVFPGRQEIENQRWWRVDFECPRVGTWNFVVSDRFYGVFDHENSLNPPEPPWKFSELWKTLADRERLQLLEQLELCRNNLNHLASLVASGVLEFELIQENIARHPAEEFEQALLERQQLLQSKTERARKQTRHRWKKDANKALIQQTGQLLEEGALTGSTWKARQREWQEYREKQRESRFSTSNWKQLWKKFSDEQLKQIVPRLNDSLFADASVQLPSSLREKIAQYARPELAQRLRDHSPEISRDQVFEARETLISDLQQWIQRFDLDIKWDGT